MRKNVILIVNPISGALDKSEIIEAAIQYAKKNKISTQIYTTSGTNDIENIQALYQTYFPKRVVIIGGDGTIKMVAEALQENDVVLGIIPAGSSNGLAVDLDLILPLDESLEVAFRHAYFQIDFVRINDKFSIHLSDLGLNADLIKNFEKGIFRGKIGYAIQSIYTLFEMDAPFQATIITNQKTIQCSARMIVIANANKYGTGIIINPNGILNDGKFELVLIKNLDLVVFSQILSGNIPLNSSDVEIISTNKATIQTNFPVSFQMDGEYCGKESNFAIEIVTKKTKIAVP